MPAGQEDLHRLASHLGLFADASTLALLQSLGRGKTAEEMARESGVALGEAERRLAPLVDAGFVALGDGRYRLVPERMFAVHEGLYRLASQPPAREEELPTSLLPRPPSDIASRAPEPRLLVLNGPHLGQSLPLLERARSRVGREKACDLRLEFDPYVSGEHAEIVREGNRTAVVDLFSHNGTYVNWVRVSPGSTQSLKPGDVIGLGRSLLVFQS